jgi:CheY-like chemotaxis protein
MNDQAGKVLVVVESDDSLREHIVAVLSDAGYEVSSNYREGMKAILAFDPDTVILGADPPQLDCCDLLSEIKGSEHTRNIRVLMLSPGGSGERTRGLDLGATMCCHCLSAHTNCCRGCVRNYGINPSRTSFESGCTLLREIEMLPSGW